MKIIIIIIQILLVFLLISCSDSSCQIDSKLEYSELLEKCEEKCEYAGQVEKIEYYTELYAIKNQFGIQDSTRIKKSAYVYLPYNYNPNLKYNVYYLMHGSYANEKYWFGLDEYKDYNIFTVNLIDYMNYYNMIDNVIFVTPSFYSYYSEDSQYYELNSKIDESTHNCSWSKYYWYEFIDLMKCVESSFHTYTDFKTDYSSFEKTRDHRAFSGLSRGSMICFESILKHCLNYVSYFGCFSSCYSDPNEIANVIRDNQNFNINYLYCSCGTLDEEYRLSSFRKFSFELYSILHSEGIMYINDFEGVKENYCWIEKNDMKHNYENWISDLFNTLLVFFNKEKNNDN